MNYSLRTLLAAACASMLLASCKKDDGGNTQNNDLNAKEKLIVGDWRVVSKKLVYYNANGSTDTIEHFKSCETDDTYSFKADKGYIVTNGSDICPSSGKNYDNLFAWKVVYDSSLDYAHGPGLQFIPTITQLDATTLTVKASVPPNGTEYFVYKRR